MTAWGGKRSQGAAWLWVAWLIAGCAAPAPPYKPVTLRESAVQSSVASRPAATRSAPERPKVVAAPERPGRIRLAAHEAESENPDTDTADGLTASEDPSDTGVSAPVSGASHPIDLGT